MTDQRHSYQPSKAEREEPIDLRKPDGTRPTPEELATALLQACQSRGKPMAPDELAHTLSEMYHNAPEREATAMIHLFGIKYAAEIRDCGAPVTEIVRLSGLYLSYSSEVYKGVRLARHVVPRHRLDGTGSQTK